LISTGTAHLWTDTNQLIYLFSLSFMPWYFIYFYHEETEETEEKTSWRSIQIFLKVMALICVSIQYDNWQYQIVCDNLGDLFVC